MSLSRFAPATLDALFAGAANTAGAINAGHAPPPARMPRFASVRLDAITHPDLIPRDRDVLAYLDSRGVGDRWTPVKIADVARYLDCHWRTAQRALKRLRDAGMILRHAVYVATPDGMRRVCDRLKLVGRRHRTTAPTSTPARPAAQPVPSRGLDLTRVSGEPSRGKDTRPDHDAGARPTWQTRLDERLRLNALTDSPD